MKIASITATAALLCTLGLAPAALAACQAAPEPAIPNGASAQADEMSMVTEEVKAYVTNMNEYVQCLSFQAKDDPSGVQKVNAAIDRIETVTMEFNKQLRAFKSRG
ncbi:MAG TPA: hypothetical protein VED40_13540 [Azospirillaceae bacterium]|nr:hypothetical protein [Azospirillaceae bacterium]